MTKESDTLVQMTALVEAKYEQQQVRFAKLVAEENNLRAEIARIDGMRHVPHDISGSGVEMRAIGADVIWHRWVGRAKTSLNLQLAQVLARKEMHQAAVRQAYGKVLVVSQLRDDAARKSRSKAAQSQLDRAISQSLWR